MLQRFAPQTRKTLKYSMLYGALWVYVVLCSPCLGPLPLKPTSFTSNATLPPSSNLKLPQTLNLCSRKLHGRFLERKPQHRHIYPPDFRLSGHTDVVAPSD
ncbi:hypothetical protein K438DRAFT_1845144, partial [Mycena galopus ATCC 62051]